MCVFVFCFFFFKQKTAYEMRISDWSSDVCSSDLGCGRETWPWIDEMLERLELSDKANVSMRALSGGMKRRVLIAQALVHRPPVVILDEQTAGVDVELRRTIWRSEEHTSELQSLMRNSYAVFCLKKKQTNDKYKYN